MVKNDFEILFNFIITYYITKLAKDNALQVVDMFINWNLKKLTKLEQQYQVYINKIILLKGRYQWIVRI